MTKNNLPYLRGPVHVSANLTPMIDVTFLLIIFFILVTQITNVQVAEEIELVQPENSVSVVPDELQRIIVNVIPADQQSNTGQGNKSTGQIAGYRLGTTQYPPTSAGLTALMRDLKAERESKYSGKTDSVTENNNLENVQIDLRADRFTSYGQIYPVMKAIVAAGFTRINLAVQAENKMPTI